MRDIVSPADFLDYAERRLSSLMSFPNGGVSCRKTVLTDLVSHDDGALARTDGF